MKNNKKVLGVASLPAILLLGGIIIEVSIAGALLLFHLNTSIYGTRLASEALVAAQAGIDDATIKITLNKNCPDGVCAPGGSYTLDVGSGNANITICKNVCSEITEVGLGEHGIISVGSVLTRQHRIIAVLTVNDVTGLVTTQFIKSEAQ